MSKIQLPEACTTKHQLSALDNELKWHPYVGLDYMKFFCSIVPQQFVVMEFCNSVLGFKYRYGCCGPVATCLHSESIDHGF